jgi:hypothetical protein
LAAGWSDAAEVVAGLEVVVVPAEAAAVAGGGEPVDGDGDVVVDLEVVADLAARDDADGVLNFDRGALVSGDGAAVVRDAGDVDSSVFDDLEEAVAHEPPGGADRDRAGAVDLADLAGFGVTTSAGDDS